MQFKGIDVSTWQKNIDWKAVEQDNVDFAIIRSSYGYTGVDEFFAKNMNEIAKTSINVGAYHYVYAKSVSEAKREALHFLDVIKPYNFQYPIAMDIEDNSILGLGKTVLTDMSMEFCQTLQDAGYYVCIYSSLNWFRNYLDMQALSKFDVWLSQWNNSPTYSGDFGIWQYSSTGSVAGISGNVDMNISYKDYPSIIANGQTSSSNEDTATTELSDTDSYTVESGDTLWEIAEKNLGSGDQYTKIMDVNNLTSDVIYSGQVLKIPSSDDEQTNQTTYTVESGDTLWGISEKFLGSGSKYNLLMKANNLTNSVIYPGQELIIPEN